MNITDASKQMSYLLRHNNEDLVMDKNGYVSVESLLIKLKIAQEELDFIVENNNKKRFSYDSTKTKIRAAQGHSLNVDIGLKSVRPPFKLFHGTSINNYNNIIKSGLQKMGRTHIHLSKDEETAYDVGKRHSKREEPIILIIDAATMHEDGFKFYLSDNNVWLTDSVPTKYISKKQ